MLLALGKIKKFIKKFWRAIILFLIAVCFFVGTSSFNYYSEKDDFIKWLSPDETANYTFSKLYGQEKMIQIFEKYNLYSSDIIHPRSFISDSGWIKPTSFLGIIIIYGKIVSLTSYKLLPYLTPFFAVVGIIFYYLLIKKIFGRSIALVSSLLLSSFPVYIYYSARSMFHNILFIVFFIMGLYFCLLMANKERDSANNSQIKQKNKLFHSWLFAALAGFFMGLALISRTSELLWLGPILLLLWLINIRNIGIAKSIIFVSFSFAAFLPVFYWNEILYGSFWHSGYPKMNQSILNIGQAGADIAKAAISGQLEDKKGLFLTLRDNIFYFGWQPYQSLKMFYFYFVRMFFWLFWPAIFGGIILFSKIKRWKIKHWAYFITYSIISLILLFYYGSWGINDNPDLKSHTIGNSYTRYWLPIYLGAFPLASLFIIKFSKIFRKKILSGLIIIAILSSIFVISIRFVLFGSEEGLLGSAKKLIASRQELNNVLSLTENSSVIITRYHDKLFFPERKVIVGLFDDINLVKEYAKLVGYLPVYYYNFILPEKDLDYLNHKRLAEVGLEIKEVSKITNDFTLYRLENVKFKSQNVK